MVRVVARLTTGGKPGYWDLIRVPVVGDILIHENGSAFRVDEVLLPHLRPDRDLRRWPGAMVSLTHISAENRMPRPHLEIAEEALEPFE